MRFVCSLSGLIGFPMRLPLRVFNLIILDFKSIASFLSLARMRSSWAVVSFLDFLADCNWKTKVRAPATRGDEREEPGPACSALGSFSMNLFLRFWRLFAIHLSLRGFV